MGIRLRVIVFTAVSLVVLTGAISFIANAVFDRAFYRLETDALRRTISRIDAALMKVEDELSRSTEDWAHWDDTYRFAQEKNPDYIADNLKDEDIATINRQIVLIYDIDFNLCFGTSLDEATGTSRPLPETLTADLPSGHPLFTELVVGEVSRDYVFVGGRLYLLVASHILTSNREGPPAGYLVFGVAVQPEVVDYVSEVIQHPVVMHLMKDEDFDGTLELAGAPHEELGDIARLGETISYVHKQLSGISGVPAARLVASIPREIHLELRRSQSMISVFVVLVVLVVGAGTIVLLERNMLQPLGKIIRTILSIDQPLPDGTRVPTVGKGEVKDLSKAINSLLAAVEESQHERQRALRELSTEKEYLTTTLASIADGVITTDAEGKLLTINPAAQHMTGWSQEEAVGQPLTVVMPLVDERTGKPVADLTGVVARLGETITRDHDVILAANNGTNVLVIESCAPIYDGEGRLAGFVEVFRDMAKIRKTDQEEFVAEKLDAVGVLAGGIAHDFNNMLTAVLHSISLARKDETSEERADAYLKSAEQSILRARGLTSQLLTFASGGEPVRGPVELVALLKHNAEMICRGGVHEIHYDIAPDLHHGFVDEGQIEQVFHNIILNAVESMPDGGSLYIGCNNVQEDDDDLPASVDGEAFVRIVITDSGIGIPADVVSRIFEPYYTTKSRGSGLGLASARSIVSKHGGAIRVNSREGVGTTMTLYLPATREQASQLEETPSAAVSSPSRILFMDDEEMLLRLSNDILASAGYQVAVAPDGQKAVDLYREALRDNTRYDCVILDLVVRGGMGGLAALREIKLIDPDAVVVVSSGYSNDPVMANYREHGFSAVLPKPYSSSALTAIVEEVIASGGPA
jgi:PAS domain S-box-containing protein